VRDTVDEYLTIRRRLGFKLTGAARLLYDFASYHDCTGSSTVSSEMMLAWAKQPADCQPVWWSIRLGVVRRFAIYLNAVDPRHEVPPGDVFRALQSRATPYLYTEADIVSLMASARALPNPQRAATYPTVIGLLAVTGMRIGEAIRLDRSDVDWSEGLLTARLSKFGKSREVVLHPSAVDALRAYDHQRRRFCPRPKTPALFVSTAGTRLLYSDVHHTFRALVREVDLKQRSPRCRPRLHDLRHTFAVNTLLGWYRTGLDISGRIHLLSNYLGHAGPDSTYWYLSAAPELLALAGERLECVLGEQS
jgi:integrase